MSSVSIDPTFPPMDSSSAVSPTVCLVDEELHLAFYLPGCEDSAIVTFEGVHSWSYGPPNDEGLDHHRYWGHGLTHYEFHRASWQHDGLVKTLWIATFHDGTLEVVASGVRIATPAPRNSSPSQALRELLGDDGHRVLDHLDG